MIEVWGVLPGEFMGAIFSMLTPVRSATKYNLDLLDVVDDERKLLNFLRMEKWLADRPHHPGEAAKEWLKDLYQDNKLINNTWQLGGRDVDLTRVTMPVLNIFALDDHIIPPATSRVLDGKLGTNDYTEMSLPGGHIGLFVSAKSQGIVGNSIVDWLAGRDA
jgi:polyhydroxyalkanoate synthase